MVTINETEATTIRTDILVLGGGIAGCTAAIKARESGLDVVLVDKGSVGRSGLSPCMSGVLACFDPESDDYDKLYEECIEVGQWLNDQECLEDMICETTERVKEMEIWGAKFQKDSLGKLIRRPTLGQHLQRVFMVNGGLQIMLALRGEVVRQGVHLVERVMATDLLTSDGELPTGGSIVGAVGFNVRNGRFYIFQSKVTIIATGATLSGLLRCIYPILSGDGNAMAFMAGCEARNIDLTRFDFRLRDFAGPIGPGLHIFGSEGVHFVNARGERFMGKWAPALMERASRALLARAIAIEEREGRGPVFVDATHLDDTSHDRIEKAIPMVIRNLAAAGQSFRTDRVPYTIALFNCGPGGIRINRDAETTLPNLFAAGDATDHGDCGVSPHLGSGMASAIVGNRAGLAAAKRAIEIGGQPVNKSQIKSLKEKIFAPMKRESGISHHEVREQCRVILERNLLGPFKNQAGLKEAIEYTQEIERQIPKITAKDYHELARSIGVRNELLLLELIARCSLLRTESRGIHYREDYQERDDINWLRWVITRKQNYGIDVWSERIPFEKYRLKPKLTN